MHPSSPIQSVACLSIGLGGIEIAKAAIASVSATISNRPFAVKSTQLPQAQPAPTYQDSPLQLTAFNDLEDELFGAPGTPERTDYEDRITLELLPKSIREYRLRHHLTQDELGQRLGVQKSQISKLERNPSNVTLATLRRVFEALNMSVQIVLKPTAPPA